MQIHPFRHKGVTLRVKSGKEQNSKIKWMERFIEPLETQGSTFHVQSIKFLSDFQTKSLNFKFKDCYLNLELI